MAKHYAGIGSRKTPEDILRTMQHAAADLSLSGWTLRSGGANGADSAFESAVARKEIFLPWKGFNGSASPMYEAPDSAMSEAARIAETLHPGWHRLSQGAKKLMTRNIRQILGQNLDDPVAFVICWTPDGCESHENRTRATGGTGQAISLASLRGIPIINLKNADALDRINQMANP